MKKILVIKLSSMGDVINALPALTDAKNAMGDISFDWVVEENFSEIPGWHSAVDKVIPISLRRWRKKIFCFKTFREVGAFWKNLRAEKYDYIIDLQGLLKSGIVSKLAHGKTYGFSKSSVRESVATYFYDKKIDVAKKLHTIGRMRKLFALVLNYSVPTCYPDYNIEKGKLSKHAYSFKKYLVFVHGASRDEKNWQVEKWIELADLAKKHGFKVKVPWGNDLELARANYIAAMAENVEVIPKSTLADIGGILLNAKGVIALDTGLGHLSAALNIPTLSLYGATDPQLVGTCGKNQIHLVDMQNLNVLTVWRELRECF